MATIEFIGVVKDFGAEKPAVDDFSIEIPDEEFLVIVGPSGCGKTTIMRMLAGLETPTAGVIKIDGKIVNNLTPKERNIALVFQSYALYPHKNVEGNLAFPLKVSGVHREEIARRVDQTAKLMGIDDLLHRKPKELSGGQRQRVALGRAIIREPIAFLMDEPLSNLDAKLRIKMRAELKKLQKELKVTTLYVTHDQVEAMTMGDRIVVIQDGILQQVGTPNEIFNTPENVFVAGFIGSPTMNFIEVKVFNEEGKYWIRFLTSKEKAVELPVPANLQDSLRSYASKKILFGIRPQHIFYNPSDLASEYILDAEVLISQPRGTEADVEISVGGNDILAVFPPEKQYEMGEIIKIGFDPRYFYLFETESGTTIF